MAGIKQHLTHILYMYIKYIKSSLRANLVYIHRHINYINISAKGNTNTSFSELFNCYLIYLFIIMIQLRTLIRILNNIQIDCTTI